jgi:hypothetical protein
MRSVTDDMRKAHNAEPDPVPLEAQQAIDVETYSLMLADILSTTSFNAGSLSIGLVVAGAKIFAQNWQGSQPAMELAWQELLSVAKSRMLQVYSLKSSEPGK